MSIPHHRRLAVLTIGAAVLVCAASASAQPPTGEQLRVISDSEMKRYVTALDQLVKLGLETDRQLDEARGSIGAAGEQRVALKYSEEMRAAVEKQGFDAQTFGAVHGNAMLAYTALELEKHRPELEQARKQQAEQMKAMKAQLPPAQYQQMMKSMSGMMSGMGMGPSVYDDVPKENLELVRKYRGQLTKILESGR